MNRVLFSTFVCILITGCIGNDGLIDNNTSAHESILNETSLALAKKHVNTDNNIEEVTINASPSPLMDKGTSNRSVATKTTDDTYVANGFACNIVHNPEATLRWSIQMYHLDTAPTQPYTIFGVTKNRKIQSVACTPDGSLALFSVRETQTGDYEVYAILPFTLEIVQLTDNETDDVDVTISADGLTMAWQERLTDGRQAIVIRTYNENWNGFTQRSLASANPFVQPALSANGDWLALVQLRKSNFLALLYNLDSKNFTTIKSIVRRKKLFTPSVSNDGTIYGWLENNSQGRYVVKNLNTGESVRALFNPEGIAHPVISPNGQWIVYSLNNENSRRIFMTHLETGINRVIGKELASPSRYLGTNWQGTIVAAATTPLNDTGITTCTSEFNKNLPCPVSTHLNQDADHGRDVTDNDNSDGVAGFSFTKLDISGQELPVDAVAWSCVKDNVTGLIWEVKTNDGGLHDKDDDYLWYSTDDDNNGGSSGFSKWVSEVPDAAIPTCFGFTSDDPVSYCNTEAFVARINEKSLCGDSDWRLPTREELRSIINYGHIRNYLSLSTHIDSNYFPNTDYTSYWSSSSDATSEYDAWCINFATGTEKPCSKLFYALPARLVRNAP